MPKVIQGRQTELWPGPWAQPLPASVTALPSWPCSKPLVSPPAQPLRPLCTLASPEVHVPWVGTSLSQLQALHTLFSQTGMPPHPPPSPAANSFIPGRPSAGTPSQGSLASLQKGTLCPLHHLFDSTVWGLLCPALKVLGHQT